MNRVQRAALMSGGLLGLAILASCATASVDAGPEEAQQMIEQADGPERAALGTNQFGFELGQHLEEGKGNAVWSPYSITSAMQMVRLGARGETADEMASTLHSGEGSHASMNALASALAEEPSATLRVVNDVWVQKGFELVPDYVDGLNEHYGAEPRLTEFQAAPESARRAINTRVSEVTEQKIEELLPPDSLSPSDRLVLVNAIYLNARWLDAFAPKETKPRPFRLADGTTVDVDTMHGKHIRKYVDAGDFEAVTLDYAGNLAAIVVLPEQGGFDEVASSMNAAKMHQLRQKMGEPKVDLYLPKFRVRTAAKLSAPLSAMGMERAFDPERADLTGMADASLFVAEVYHQAFIDVHEEGTEAAAATGSVVRLTSAKLAQDEVEMRVDRPFLFYVIHQQTGAILFATRVVDPSAESP